MDPPRCAGFAYRLALIAGRLRAHVGRVPLSPALGVTRCTPSMKGGGYRRDSSPSSWYCSRIAFGVSAFRSRRVGRARGRWHVRPRAEPTRSEEPKKATPASVCCSRWPRRRSSTCAEGPLYWRWSVSLPLRRRRPPSDRIGGIRDTVSYDAGHRWSLKSPARSGFSPLAPRATRRRWNHGREIRTCADDRRAPSICCA